MASSAASEAIFFIAAVLIASALVATFGNVVSDLGGGIRTRGTAFSKEMRTDITIVNDPEAMATSPLAIYVKNTGATTLHPTLTTILVDGAVSASTAFDVVGSADDTNWKATQVVKITVSDIAIASGDHRVRVVSEYGTEAVFEFNKA